MSNEHPNEKVSGHDTQLERAENRTKQADVRTEQANIRTQEANIRTEQEMLRGVQAILASEVRYRRLFETAQDGILILDAETGQVVDANPFMKDLLGYSQEEFLGRKLWEIGPFKGEAASKIAFAELQLKDRLRYEGLPLETKDGRRVEVEFISNAYLVEQKKLIQCNIRDITERKRAEANLIRLAAIVESSDDAIIGKDLNGVVTSWNKGAENIFGYSAAEMVGDSMLRLTPADRQDEETKFLTHSNHGESVRQFETVRQAKDGRLLDVSVTISPIHDAGGRVIGVSKVARDITQAKKTEARFRRLIDSNAQGVIFWNKKGEITDGNDAFLKLTGYTRDDLQGGHISWSAMTPPEYDRLDKAAMDEIAATGVCAMYEKEWIRKDGTLVPILIGAATFADNPDEGVGFVLDITSRKKLEEEFRQSQKMEAIGQLAGGVAHDFNNILAVIQLQIGLLQAENNLSPTQADFAEEIGIAAQRAAALSHQLLLFSRKETMQTHDMDLNQSINNMTKMLRRILGEDIQMQFKFSMQPTFIHADAGMMDQVLMNLVVNSRDAMPRGGQLVIETSTVEFDESVRAQSSQSRPGSFVCLSVSDTGGGIAPEILPKIFEPFFTTKDVGKGTGLGLATIFGIVKQHQGWVSVSTQVGRGTTFRIYLPRLAKMSGYKPEQPAVTSPRGGNETILLVEDDIFLHASMRTTLLQLGYRVLEASNGAEAQEVWRRHHDEINLLLTDLVMPGGMTGVHLARSLLKENPRLKVVYMSGYSTQFLNGDSLMKTSANFLAKPFRSHKLAQTIREILDAQST
jgi:PAS domain S-box-containing protein